MKLLLVAFALFISACAPMTKMCEAHGGEWSLMWGCMNPQTGALINHWDEPGSQQTAAIDPVTGLLMFQMMQSTPRYQYRPLPVLPLNQLGTSCSNTFAGNQITTQCY